jgi:penicillin-binding protein 2
VSSRATSATRPGRFLPGDPRTEEPYRLTPQLAFRIAILAALALAVFAVLFLRLWALQVLSGDRYLTAANDNRVRTLRVEAPRGPVLDRNGRVLVKNVAGTRVELWPADLPKTWDERRAELRALAKVTGATVPEMLAQLKEREEDPLTPVVVQRGLKRDQINYLKEHRAEFPGVRLPDSYLRDYPYRSLAAQVLGYVGQISAGDYKRLKSKGYQPTDAIGQAGIERTYDTYLRGRDGKAQLTVDSRGRPKSAAVPQAAPTPGEALRLTLDAGVQRAAEKALRYGIGLARSSAEGRYADGGAIVALDPRDGAILAMASNPTFKPSVYTGRNDRKKLAPLLDAKAAEEANVPGLNRATQGVYPPGSTFKPVTAIAAMQAHALEPRSLLPCTPDYKSHGQTFKNWTTAYDRGMTLVEALATSCDTYFYRVGETIYGLPESAGHPLQDWARTFGIGSPTGIDVGP